MTLVVLRVGDQGSEDYGCVANPFSIHKSSEQGLSVLALEGYRDAHTAPVFEKAVQSEFEGGRVAS